MESRTQRGIGALGGLLAYFVLVTGVSAEDPVGSAFTYQGRLKQDGVTVNEPCDFRFSLWDAAEAGNQVGSTEELEGVTVSNGLFTVELSFGDEAFDGMARWLETEVACPAGAAQYTALTPRQPITATPYAIYALEASWAGLTDVPDDFADGVDAGQHVPLQLSGDVAGDAAVISARNTGTGRAVDAMHQDSGNIGSLGTPEVGVYGYNAGYYPAIYGESTNGNGVCGESVMEPGVVGRSTNTHGVLAETSSQNDAAVEGRNFNSGNTGGLALGICGVRGESGSSGDGVIGTSVNGRGVAGTSVTSHGVYGSSTQGYAGCFEGDVNVTGGATVGEELTVVQGAQIGGNLSTNGSLQVAGKLTVDQDLDVFGDGLFDLELAVGGNIGVGGDLIVSGNLAKGSGEFRIDHPLDPANKYLSHSFVESPDMMNVYNGNVVLDGNGTAVIQLPAWFEALNRDFRYQLTCIGGFAPVYVAREISEGCFAIGGGKPGLKVSWQVTGIRQDPYAEAHRIKVEEDKPVELQGLYVHPDVYGQPATKSVSAAQRRRLAEARRPAERR